MLAERQPLESALGRLGSTLQRAPEAHAGGKWRLRYASVLGQGGTLELDINYMYRTPLWPIKHQNSRAVGSRQVTGIPVLDIRKQWDGLLLIPTPALAGVGLRFEIKRGEVSMNITRVGVDIAKSTFHVHAVDRAYSEANRPPVPTDAGH